MRNNSLILSVRFIHLRSFYRNFRKSNAGSLWRRFVVYNAEHAIETLGVAEGPGGQFSLVVDRSTSGRRNQDPKLALAVLPELMEHYPELLGNVYVAPVNALFFAVWRVIKIFLAAQTKRKFVLIPAGPRWREELRERPSRPCIGI